MDTLGLHNRTAVKLQLALLVLLAILSGGCRRTFVPFTNPHVYSGGEAAYVSEEEELQRVKAVMSDLCISGKFPKVSVYDSRYEAHKKACAEWQQRKRELRQMIQAMQNLQDEAGGETSGPRRSIDGPLKL